MEKVDEATVRALESKAPKASITDAKNIHGLVISGQIFGAFDIQIRERIWNKLKVFDGLIPSIHTFFEDTLYLQGPIDCIRRLVRLDCRETVSMAIRRAFTGVNQRDGSVVQQVAENAVIHTPGSLEDQLDLGYRQLIIFSMRNYVDVPKKPTGRNLLAKPTATADKTVLRNMANLAERLGFESTEITAAKQYQGTSSSEEYETSRPQLVGSGQKDLNRCGTQLADAYRNDVKFLYMHNLHDERDEQGEDITSFFVLRSQYFAFFGKPTASRMNRAALEGAFEYIRDPRILQINEDDNLQFREQVRHKK